MRQQVEDNLIPSRRGEWLQTYCGLAFWPLDPRIDEILIEDIAHSLSLQCRFAGHTKAFYSVAQHSVLVSRNVPPEHVAWGLLHDASEAYLVDLPRPVKDASRLGYEYKQLEQKVMNKICQRFGISTDQPECVSRVDNAVLMAEARDLLSNPPMPWANEAKPLSERVVPWSPKRAETEFLNIAKRLKALGKIW